MTIRPMGAKLFYADRLTDRHDEANNRFSQFHECDQNPLPKVIMPALPTPIWKAPLFTSLLNDPHLSRCKLILM